MTLMKHPDSSIHMKHAHNIPQQASQDRGEQQTCNTQTKSSQQSAHKCRKGDTHYPNKAKMLRQPPPHRNVAQCCIQVQTQPEASKQSTKGETKQLHTSICVNIPIPLSQLHMKVCKQRSSPKMQHTIKFNTKVLPFFTLWVLINTINECALSHHNVHPPMSPSTIVPLIYHQGLPSSMPPSKQLHQYLILHKCHTPPFPLILTMFSNH